MTQQTIEVEGLPEGWKAVAFRIAYNEYVIDCGQVVFATYTKSPRLIVEKIQPRRKVLEKTGEERSVSYGDWYEDENGNVIPYLNKSFGTRRTYKIWKEVKE